MTTQRDEDPDAANLVTVARFSSPLEAEFALGRLKSAGIECVMPEEQMAVIYNFGLTAMGGIRLQVRAEDEEDARAILADPGI